MLKSYKFRLYPNKEQKELFEKHFGCCRFIWNNSLAIKIKAYQKDKTNVSRFDLQETLVETKNQEEYNWLKEVNSQSLQAVLKNLDKAYTKFFRDKKGFPKFKSKKDNHKSFSCPQNVKIDFDNKRISVPKIKNIKIKISRDIIGVIKATTISKTPTNKYFVSITTEIPNIKIDKLIITENTSIGIDLGIKTYATLSNGIKIENPKHLKKSLDKLKVLQQRLSKKQKGSKNREKARLKVALLHEKISNQRNDYIHKLTHKLICESQADTFIVENLNVSKMIKNHNLSREISDVGWSEFNRQMEYKSDLYNKNYIQIGRFEPSTKLCNICGEINNNLTLEDRTWVCNNCKTEHDRDLNAAINIKKIGLHSQNLLYTGGTSGRACRVTALAEQ